jgi:hypothetical protein
MINPTTGGYAPESELRFDLDKWRIYLESYRTLDRLTGGLSTVTQNIIELERALDSTDTSESDATYDFLRRNGQVKWNSGTPTWDHYQLVDGEWVITTYQVAVTLSNPQRREPAENL